MMTTVCITWIFVIILFFFFSSRRRHTRLQGDWSSDVCSSDLRSCQFSVISGPLIRKNNQESTELNEIWTGEARRECRFSPSSSLPCAASAALVNDRTVIGNAGSAKKFFEG